MRNKISDCSDQESETQTFERLAAKAEAFLIDFKNEKKSYDSIDRQYRKIALAATAAPTPTPS